MSFEDTPDYMSQRMLHWIDEAAFFQVLMKNDVYFFGGVADRVGESSGDLDRTADQVVESCGARKVLDVGSGEGALVSALLARGADASGLDVSEVVVGRCNERVSGRFFHGSVLALPFGDDSFHTVVSTDCLEHLAPEDVPRALAETRRVAARFVFLRIATTQGRDHHWHLTVEGRAWWEARSFEAGLRKHPAYYRLNDYESLNREDWQICIPLEKIPAAALEKYPLEALSAERGLHMDMLRDSGERSDAHVVRYQWACGYLKPGDRVLDAACGLGYGSHLVAHLSQAATITGIDGSVFAVDYARLSFSDGGRTRFEAGMLPEALSRFEEGSFDAIISFETLEHVENPAALVKEFARVLTPGGRVIVSVPNDWSDETGRDPNPFHLHVFDWARLTAELAGALIVEEAFAQTASQCKATRLGKNVWERRQRSLRKVALDTASPPDCEWWLMTAMKSPLGARIPYREGPFANVAATRHPAVDFAAAFENPWLVHAMLNLSYRLRNAAALDSLAAEVMARAPRASNDYAAALCVAAYRVLEAAGPSRALAQMLADIDRCVGSPPEGAMGLRWKVSLLFVKARMLQKHGRLEEAQQEFAQCAVYDARPFAVHLATKTTEAWFMAGKLAYARGRDVEAKDCWQRGVASGRALLELRIEEILIDPDFPNRFNHGDGVREYAVAWDNIARCANGLHLLKRGAPFDDAALENSFQQEYATVTRDLVHSRQVLAERTGMLETATANLVQRTAMLERANADLLERTDDLVRTRELLQERTAALEEAHAHERLAGIERALAVEKAALQDREATLQTAAADVEAFRKSPLLQAIKIIARKLLH